MPLNIEESQPFNSCQQPFTQCVATNNSSQIVTEDFKNHQQSFISHDSNRKFNNKPYKNCQWKQLKQNMRWRSTNNSSQIVTEDFKNHQQSFISHDSNRKFNNKPYKHFPWKQLKQNMKWKSTTEMPVRPTQHNLFYKPNITVPKVNILL